MSIKRFVARVEYSGHGKYIDKTHVFKTEDELLKFIENAKNFFKITQSDCFVIWDGDETDTLVLTTRLEVRTE